MPILFYFIISEVMFLLTYILKNNGIPIYEQLYEYIKNDIVKGKIQPEEKLPSKRVMADRHSISVITVENAYSQLCAEGYIYSKPRSGYYANSITNNIYLHKSDSDIIPVKEKLIRSDNKYDFGTDGTDTENFPFSVWTKLMRRVMEDNRDQLLARCDPKGVYELRSEIAAYLKAYRNIDCKIEDIIVGAGSEYLMNIIIQLMEYKRYAIEDPGYGKIAHILDTYGAETQFIPLDGNGVKIKPLIYSGAKVLHVSPSHQFPTGITMPVKRRYELLQWAEDAGGYIIEDDYDSEFFYSGRPIPALKSLDVNGRVIYMNTFAKSLAPSLRISYMVLPRHLTLEFEKELMFYSNTVSGFEQYTLARFMKEGHFERHLNRMRNIYKGRIYAIKQTVKALDRGINVTGENMGLHLILETKENAAMLAKRAAEKSVYVRDMSSFYKDKTSAENRLVLGFTKISAEDIPQGINRIFLDR